VELFSGYLRRSGKLIKIRLYDSNNYNNYNYRKIKGISLERKLNSASFS
jgi:hypothetical protein